MFEIPVKRKTEIEALNAIADLEDRGFVLSFPLKQVQDSSYSGTGYNYQQNKTTPSTYNPNTFWFAKMRRNGR